MFNRLDSLDLLLKMTREDQQEIIEKFEELDVAEIGEQTWATRVSNAEKEELTKKTKSAKDPAFIPKTGYYFEHDSREGVNQTEPEPNNNQELIKSAAVVTKFKTAQQQQQPRRKQTNNNNNKKNFKSISVRNADEIDTNERWKHDRFDLDEQQPKTENEIVKRYGFDIRKAKDLNQVVVNEHVADNNNNNHKRNNKIKSKRPQSSGSHSKTPQRHFENNNNEPIRNNRSNYRNKNQKQYNKRTNNNNQSLNDSFNYYEKENDYNKVNVSNNWESDVSKLRRPPPRQQQQQQQLNRPNTSYTRASAEPTTKNTQRPYSTQNNLRNSNERTFNNNNIKQRPYEPKHLQLENSITYNEAKMPINDSDHKRNHHHHNNNDMPKRYSSIRNQKPPQNGYSQQAQQQHPQIHNQHVYPQPTPFIYQNKHHYQYDMPIQQQQQHQIQVMNNQQPPAQYYYVQAPPHQQQSDFYNNSPIQTSHVYYNSQQHTQMIQQMRQSKAIPIINPHGY